MTDSNDATPGQAAYSKRLLRVYDLWVLGISNQWIWKCPSAKLLAFYNRHISNNHLDVGVGTGYFLDRCEFPEPPPRVALMDLNANSLDSAAGRIARYHPETYQANVLEQIKLETEPFDSIGINYLLHCLPGSITEKTLCLDHLSVCLKPGGIIFGSTLLSGGVQRGEAARRLMAFYNQKGIFGNTQDDLEGLTAALEKRFVDVQVEVIGCVALFSGEKLKR
ncbi:MAG: class I SAM-dependent methyltransferase [Verrucomicrobiota bacterium]